MPAASPHINLEMLMGVESEMRGGPAGASPAGATDEPGVRDGDTLGARRTGVTEEPVMVRERASLGRRSPACRGVYSHYR